MDTHVPSDGLRRENPSYLLAPEDFEWHSNPRSQSEMGVIDQNLVPRQQPLNPSATYEPPAQLFGLEYSGSEREQAGENLRPISPLSPLSREILALCGTVEMSQDGEGQASETLRPVSPPILSPLSQEILALCGTSEVLQLRPDSPPMLSPLSREILALCSTAEVSQVRPVPPPALSPLSQEIIALCNTVEVPQDGGVLEPLLSLEQGECHSLLGQAGAGCQQTDVERDMDTQPESTAHLRRCRHDSMDPLLIGSDFRNVHQSASSLGASFEQYDLSTVFPGILGDDSVTQGHDPLVANSDVAFTQEPIEAVTNGDMLYSSSESCLGLNGNGFHQPERPIGEDNAQDISFWQSGILGEAGVCPTNAENACFEEGMCQYHFSTLFGNSQTPNSLQIASGPEQKQSAELGYAEPIPREDAASLWWSIYKHYNINLNRAVPCLVLHQPPARYSSVNDLLVSIRKQVRDLSVYPPLSTFSKTQIGDLCLLIGKWLVASGTVRIESIPLAPAVDPEDIPSHVPVPQIIASVSWWRRFWRAREQFEERNSEAQRNGHQPLTEHMLSWGAYWATAGWDELWPPMATPAELEACKEKSGAALFPQRMRCTCFISREPCPLHGDENTQRTARPKRDTVKKMNAKKRTRTSQKMPRRLSSHSYRVMRRSRTPLKKKPSHRAKGRISSPAKAQEDGLFKPEPEKLPTEKPSHEKPFPTEPEEPVMPGRQNSAPEEPQSGRDEMNEDRSAEDVTMQDGYGSGCPDLSDFITFSDDLSDHRTDELMRRRSMNLPSETEINATGGLDEDRCEECSLDAGHGERIYIQCIPCLHRAENTDQKGEMNC